ncbi:acyltransferase family protein [Candidatus Uabimicrobium amorphum]|uniref:acyltransferase family protein n=1 Tax=Uabimicrobium amorphum TaxID=2596890 RepID=UPI001565817A|nr:acyltransferase [Candidatus Uabimicrobium amorphum]
MPHNNKNYIEELDGLRGIPVLPVIAYHSTITYFVLHPHHGANLSVLSNFVLKIVSLFWCSVDLFFVISGFLITKILLDNKETTNYFKAFYGRRVLRVFPLYYALLCIHFFLIAPLLIKGGIKEELTGYPHQFYYWFYVSNFLREPSVLSHFWSLAVEEQFYCIWPFCVYFLSRRQLMWTCFLIIAISIASRFYLCLSGDFSYAYTVVYARSDTIMMGSLVAILNIGWENKKLIKIALCSLITLLLLYSTYLFDFSRPMVAAFPVGERILHSTWRHLIVGVMFSAILIIVLKENKTVLHRVCTLSFFKVLGKYSYSIYACHVFIVFVVIKSPLGFNNLVTLGIPPLFAVVLQFAICSLLSLLVAIVTWYLIEIHFLRMKKIFAYKR